MEREAATLAATYSVFTHKRHNDGQCREILGMADLPHFSAHWGAFYGLTGQRRAPL
jgi:hypothetical protein